MTSFSTFPILSITANEDEDALLEYCKQLTWEISLVKNAKRCNRSWPQVAYFNNLVPHIFHYATPAIRKTYFSTLEKYGDFVRYFKTYAPGRRADIRDDLQNFETWGYELIKADAYLKDERYGRGIFPKIHATVLKDYLLVIYPSFFAAEFEVELARKRQLESDMNASLKFTASLSTAQNQVATSFYNQYDNVTSPTSSIMTTSTLPTTYTNNSDRRNTSQSGKNARLSIGSTSSHDNFVPGTIADKHEKLCMEIEELYKNSIPPRRIEENRKRLVDKIVNMLRRQFPKVKLRVAMFGSSATGLDFADSDLDLCILVPSQYFNMDAYDMFHKQRERNSYYNMFCISGMLKRAGMTNIEAIPRANVPICKFEDPRLQIKADINTHNDMGVENSKLIKEYTLLDARVKPFLYAIKTFTKKRQINDSTASTLSSYTYVLMGLFYLMTCSPPVIPNLQNLEDTNNKCDHLMCRSRISEPKLSLYRGRPKLFDVSFHDCVTLQNIDQSGISRELQLYHEATRTGNNSSYSDKNILGGQRTIWRCHNRQTVGDLLVGFFSYYGNVFDYSTTISIRVGTTIPKLSSWGKRNRIAVEDPFIKERNVAVSCSKEGFDRVMNEFRRALRLLRTNVDFGTVCEPLLIPSRSQESNDSESRFTFEVDQNTTFAMALSAKNDNEFKMPSKPFTSPSLEIKEAKPTFDIHSDDYEEVTLFGYKINPSNSSKADAEQMRKHEVMIDARQQADQTPQPEEEELSDMEFVEFSPLPISQQQNKPITRPDKSAKKTKNVHVAKPIESDANQQTVPSHEIDVKFNTKRKDDTEEEKRKKKPSTVKVSTLPSTSSSNPNPKIPATDTIGFIEVHSSNSPSVKNTVSSSTFFAESCKASKDRKLHKDEDRIIGTLSTDDEQDEKEKPTAPTSTNNGDGQTKTSIGTMTKVVVKKATMKLVDMPDYVDKIDIIDALEAFGFEVITIRSEIINNDELGMFPTKEWLVRITGGRNEDLPTRFELQDMALVRSYETRRLVAYHSLHLNTIMEC